MQVVPDYIKLLSYLFMITYMLSVGLETTRGRIVSILKDSKTIGFALLANLVLVPLLGVILTRVIPVPSDIKTGLLLLAIAPGGPFALNFARVSKGNIHLAVALFVLLSLLAIVITPVLAHFLFGSAGPGHNVLYPMITLSLVILVPLYAGRAIQNFTTESASEKLSKLIGTLSIVLFIVVTLLSTKIKSPAMKSVGRNGLAIMVLLVIISWGIGWILGGPEVRNRKTMAISTSLRNVGVCLLIAVHQFSATNVIVPILAFSGISIPMNMLFAIGTKLLFRDREVNELESSKQPIPKSNL
jgi:BASS family bile acid:Na+ symporter